jgi:hypothetical protein
VHPTVCATPDQFVAAVAASKSACTQSTLRKTYQDDLDCACLDRRAAPALAVERLKGPPSVCCGSRASCGASCCVTAGVPASRSAARALSAACRARAATLQPGGSGYHPVCSFRCRLACMPALVSAGDTLTQIQDADGALRTCQPQIRSSMCHPLVGLIKHRRAASNGAIFDDNVKGARREDPVQQQRHIGQRARRHT